MDNHWLTTELRRSLPNIEGYLERIANALENIAFEMKPSDDPETLYRRMQEDTRCDWCDHRHNPAVACQEHDCECLGTTTMDVLVVD